MKKAALLLLLFLICSTSYLRSEPKILCISDIHFDPFYDTTLVKDLINEPYYNWKALFDAGETGSLGKYGKDANYNLLRSLMEDLSVKKDEFDLVIISGDFLSHEFNQNFFHYSGTNSTDSLKLFIEKTVYFIKGMFSIYLPEKYVIPALGNNDSYCGDYMIEPGGEFLSMFSRCWSDKVPGNSFRLDFPNGGYYSLNYPPESANRFIILNTVFFSNNYSNECGNKTSDPGKDELSWLGNILNESRERNEKVWLVYHIAPGIDVFSTLENEKICNERIVTLWKEEYTESFLDLTYNYSSIIKAQVAGHIHRDDFRVLLRSGSPYSFIHLNPAVSPVYGNNPSYQMLTVDNSGFSIRNAESFYLNISTDDQSWVSEYNFNRAYGEDGVNANSLYDISNRMLTDEGVKNKYFRYYTSSMNKGLSGLEEEWFAYWCGITNLRLSEYQNCFCR